MTKTERLILVNQLKILAHLEPENRDFYNESIEILENGYSVFYDSITNNIYDEMQEEKGNLVLNILDLYCAVECFKKNGGTLKGLKHIEFMGFDGNYETDYMMFARFLIEKQHKFAEIKEALGSCDFNSHSPMVQIYEKILERWKQNLNGLWPTNREEFEKIFEKE